MHREGDRDVPVTLQERAEVSLVITVRVQKRSSFDQKWISMNINGIGSSALSGLSSAASSTQTTKTKSSIPPAANGAATSNISKPAELLQKLQQLEQQDPAQAKQILTQLAETLQKAADQSKDANSPIAKLAAAFKSAADTGDLSSVQAAMKPPSASTTSMPSGTQGAKGHHHGHHHGGGALATAFSTAIGQIESDFGPEYGIDG